MRVVACLRYFALLVVLVASVPNAWADLIHDISNELPATWTGGAYADDSTQAFSSCVASAEYNSDVTMYVVIDGDYSWYLGFSHPDWRLPGSKTPLSYRIDRGRWVDGMADVMDRDMMRVPMPGDETSIRLFRGGNTMEVITGEGHYFFNLTGTSRLVALLADCVERYSNSPPPTQVAATEPPAASGGQSEGPGPSSGTGIVVSEGGYVLTNHHVVDQCAAISVTQTGGTAKTAQVVRTDPSNDLAVLKVDTTYLKSDVAAFRVGGTVQAGEIVAVYGFPLAGMLSLSGNIVSGNVTALSGLADDVRYLQISAPVQPGNSGGPVLDPSGLVVGVVNARMNDVAMLDALGSLPQNVNFAIKGNIATNFLDAHSIPYRTAGASDALSLVDIATMAKRFGVLVECN